MNKSNYTAANAMPWKLLQTPNTIVNGGVVPYHIQLIPTNRCNGNCPWCSCSHVDRKLELSISELMEIVDCYKQLGTKAITITGGGEPTIHPQINNLLKHIKDNDIEIGIVTNGIAWTKVRAKRPVPDSCLTWVRISVTDTEGDYDVKIIETLANNLPSVDIGVSFTVTTHVNKTTARDICQLVNFLPNVTHIRFVQDIITASKMDSLAAMRWLETSCKDLTDKSIFQYRNLFKSGTKNCHISKLKPLIGADGYVYPCCGVQYAGSELRTLPESFRMCKWDEFGGTEHFDGRVCSKCYYSDYNECLDRLLTPSAHQAFL